MKVFGFLLLSLLIPAAHLQAQDLTGFIPVYTESSEPSKDFGDDESIIADIEFIGLDAEDPNSNGSREHALQKKDFLNRFNRFSKIIRPGDLYSGVKVFNLKKELENWLSSEGYPLATVKIFGAKLPERRTTLRLVIDRGQLITTINIEFSGNDHVSSKDLLEDFKGCGGGDLWQKYEVAAYKYIAERCSRRAFQSRGFLKARFLDMASQVTGGVRIVTVKFLEGNRYRLGQIRVEGNRVISTPDIVEMLGQRTGDVANASAVQQLAFETLKDRYNDLGYVQYDADWDSDFVEPRAADLDGIVNLTLKISEGSKFRVRSVRFAGVGDDEQENLKGMFGLKAGEIFTARKLKEAVSRLNDLGRYEKLDADGDVSLFTGDAEGASDIELVIRLTRPGPD